MPDDETKDRVRIVYGFVGMLLLVIFAVLTYIILTHGKKMNYLSRVNTDYVLPENQAIQDNPQLSTEENAPKLNDRDLLHNENLMHEIEQVQHDTIDMGAVQPISPWDKSTLHPQAFHIYN